MKDFTLSGPLGHVDAQVLTMSDGKEVLALYFEDATCDYPHPERMGYFYDENAAFEHAKRLVGLEDWNMQLPNDEDNSDAGG